MIIVQIVSGERECVSFNHLFTLKVHFATSGRISVFSFWFIADETLNRILLLLCSGHSALCVRVKFLRRLAARGVAVICG